MTLVDASNLISPILNSRLLKENEGLQKRMKEVEKHLTGYKIKNPYNLNSFEILDDEIEGAVKKLVNCYNQIISNSPEKKTHLS